MCAHTHTLTHTHTHSWAHAHTKHIWPTKEGTPGKSGKNLGAQLAQAHPTDPGSPGLWLAGPEALSRHRSHPLASPASIYSTSPPRPSPPGLQHFLPGIHTAGPCPVKGVNKSRRGARGLAVKMASPSSGALGHPSPKPGLSQGFLWISI